MEIGFSFVDLAMGGAQTFLVQLAQGLAGRGHRILYFLHADRSDLTHAEPSLVSAVESTARPVSRPSDLLACAAIQLDGYHSLRRKLPFLFHLDRCVETYHSTYSVRRSGPVYAHHRVAISRAVQAELHHPSRVIYYGFSLPPQVPDGDRPFDVAILGRIHPVKQHLLFLKVCEALYQARGSLHALMIGGHPKPGPYQAQVDAEVGRLQSAGVRIHLTGDVPSEAVYSWLCQAKILLVTSESEGFGRMAVEGMACQTPVVANPVGGLLEIVQAGENGFLAQKDEVLSFAGLASRLLDDESLRRQLGRNGRRLAESRFSTTAMLDAYEALYQDVASSIPANRRRQPD